MWTLDNGVLIAVAGLAGGLIKAVSDYLIARLANHVKASSPTPAPVITAGDPTTQFFFENAKDTITRLTAENAQLYKDKRDAENEALEYKNELMYYSVMREKFADMQTVHQVWEEEIRAVATLRRIGGLYWYKREGVLEKMAQLLTDVIASSGAATSSARPLLTEGGYDGSSTSD